MYIHPIIVSVVLGVAIEAAVLFLMAIRWDEKREEKQSGRDKKSDNQTSACG